MVEYLVWGIPLNAGYEFQGNLFTCPHIEDTLRRRPWTLGAIFAVSLVVTLNVLREVRKANAGRAFLSSCGALTLHLLFSMPNHAHNMTIYNSASTAKTVRFTLVVALIGVPIVLTYTIAIYYVFRGKVQLTESRTDWVTVRARLVSHEAVGVT